MNLLCDFLPLGAITCPLSETQKWKAIEKCLAFLPEISKGKIALKNAMSSIREREEKESTLLENGVAIPHGIMPDPTPLLCALGVSSDGVSYGSAGEKANIIFVIIGSLSVRKDYLGIIAQIARLFRRKELRKKILVATTPDEVLRLIRSAEE